MFNIYDSDIDFYKRQIKVWQNKVEDLEPGTGEYDTAMNALSTLYGYIDDIEKTRMIRDKAIINRFEIGVKVVTAISTTVLAGIGIKKNWDTAKLAWKKEADMDEVCNRTVWNLKDKNKT